MVRYVVCYLKNHENFIGGRNPLETTTAVLNILVSNQKCLFVSSLFVTMYELCARVILERV